MIKRQEGGKLKGGRLRRRKEDGKSEKNEKTLRKY